MDKKIELVKRLKNCGYMRTKKVEKGFLEVDRAIFIPDNLKHFAYHDYPLEIGFGQTISAPHMVVIMCELLELEKGQKVLEIGAGSGYHAAMIANIVGKNGGVYTVENIPALAEIAAENIKMAGYGDSVHVIVGDGSLGYEEKGPYDAILVTCAAPQLPDPLKEQLNTKGNIVIPIGSLYLQTLYRFKKSGENWKREVHGDVVFVPMRGKFGFHLS